MSKTALVLGGAGFIGHHLAKRLHSEGYTVRVVDLKLPAHCRTIDEIEYVIGDLRDTLFVKRIIVDKYQEPFYTPKPFDEVYQLAADMGGAGYIFTGEHDADVMHNSAKININVCEALIECGFKGKVFYSSSACMYPQEIQEKSNNPGLKESDAYPANPDSEYGWEKLFSERLFLAYHRNYGLQVRIARFHNIFGPEGTYNGGKEKAPAAICRKVAEATLKKKKIKAFVNWMGSGTTGKPSIEVWGDGEQTRSFLYVDECVEGVRRLMQSDFTGPVNIGSDEMVSINQLAKMAMEISGHDFNIKHIPGPTGVRGRNSDNTLIYESFGWKPSQPLYEGLKKTYEWINKQING